MPQEKFNAFYAQSGGVTAVINASACGLIEAARKENKISAVYAGRNGIIGALTEDLIDTSKESDLLISKLKHTPAGAFGSCRHKLSDPSENPAEYLRLMEVFKAHNIRYFFYNGGGDSQDTTNKIAQFSKANDYPLVCIGIPKTIDNDLPITDNCPGFGSVAKYVAVSIKEAGFDVASMAQTSTKVFVLEVMGRHAGWIAAASGLASTRDDEAPHIILFPEQVFNKDLFLARVKKCEETFGYCAIVVSEGVRDDSGAFLSDSGTKDAFGHAQLGGTAPIIANLIRDNLNLKYHWAVADYLQRSARHIASKTDVDQAYALGESAVVMALSGDNAVMPVIERVSDQPYKWKIGKAKLSDVANVEKTMPRHFMSKDGFSITSACRKYLQPLIIGEDYPPYINGIPDYARLNNAPVKKKLKENFDLSDIKSTIVRRK
jgi:6-phosphofructokinase 1